MTTRTEKLNESISELNDKISNIEKKLTIAVLAQAEGEETPKKPEVIRKRLNLLKDQLSDLKGAIPTAKERDEADAKAAEEQIENDALNALPKATAKQVKAAKKVEEILDSLDKAFSDYKKADDSIHILLKTMNCRNTKTMYENSAMKYVKDRIDGRYVKSLSDELAQNWDERLYWNFIDSDSPRPKPKSILNKEKAQADEKRQQEEAEKWEKERKLNTPYRVDHWLDGSIMNEHYCHPNNHIHYFTQGRKRNSGKGDGIKPDRVY